MIMTVKTPGSQMGSPAAAEEGGEEVGGGRWVRGPRRKTLRALQRQHLNRPLQTDVCEGTLVLGPTTHDVRRKGAL